MIDPSWRRGISLLQQQLADARQENEQQRAELEKWRDIGHRVLKVQGYSGWLDDIKSLLESEAEDDD